jgi:hypothetical protein
MRSVPLIVWLLNVTVDRNVDETSSSVHVHFSEQCGPAFGTASPFASHCNPVCLTVILCFAMLLFASVACWVLSWLAELLP